MSSPITPQEAIDRVAEYLTRPGAQRAADNDGCCQYATIIGGREHRCAIGCLLSDTQLEEARQVHGMADELLEIESIREALQQLFVASLRLNGKQDAGVEDTLAWRLQDAHDTPMNWDETGFFNARGRSGLCGIANDFGLTVPDCVKEHA
jgi:hypothetical protein